MKKVILMRHANYDVDTGALIASGDEQILSVADSLILGSNVPDVILYSPMRRTMETAERLRGIFTQKAQKEPRLTETPQLADDAAEKIDVLVENMPDTVQTILLVTHMQNIFNLSAQLMRPPVSAITAEANIHVLESNTWKDLGRARQRCTIRPPSPLDHM